MKHLFNTWRPFPKEKPEKDGWYQCTLDDRIPGLPRYVMDLYWCGEVQRFKDNRIQDIFNRYDVYGYNKETHEYDKPMCTNHLCDRTDNVVAWKLMQKPYMIGFVEEESKW